MDESPKRTKAMVNRRFTAMLDVRIKSHKYTIFLVLS